MMQVVFTKFDRRYKNILTKPKKFMKKATDFSVNEAQGAIAELVKKMQKDGNSKGKISFTILMPDPDNDDQIKKALFENVEFNLQQEVPDFVSLVEKDIMSEDVPSDEGLQILDQVQSEVAVSDQNDSSPIIEEKEKPWNKEFETKPEIDSVEEISEENADELTQNTNEPQDDETEEVEFPVTEEIDSDVNDPFAFSNDIEAEEEVGNVPEEEVPEPKEIVGQQNRQNFAGTVLPGIAEYSEVSLDSILSQKDEFEHLAKLMGVEVNPSEHDEFGQRKLQIYRKWYEINVSELINNLDKNIKQAMSETEQRLQRIYQDTIEESIDAIVEKKLPGELKEFQEEQNRQYQDILTETSAIFEQRKKSLNNMVDKQIAAATAKIQADAQDQVNQVAKEQEERRSKFKEKLERQNEEYSEQKRNSLRNHELELRVQDLENQRSKVVDDFQKKVDTNENIKSKAIINLMNDPESSLTTEFDRLAGMKREHESNIRFKERTDAKLEYAKSLSELAKSKQNRKKSTTVPQMPQPIIVGGGSIPENGQLAEKLNEVVEMQRQLVQMNSIPETAPKHQVNKWGIVAAAAILVSLIGGGVAVYSANSQRQIAEENYQKQESEFKRQLDQLSSSKSEQGLTERASDSTKTEDTDSIDNLIAQEKYLVAAEKYSDRNSIDKIVQAAYEKDAVEKIKALNQDYTSTFGLVDAAILSKDNKTIVSEYSKLSDTNKAALKTSQKNAIKLALIDQGKAEEAKTL